MNGTSQVGQGHWIAHSTERSEALPMQMVLMDFLTKPTERGAVIVGTSVFPASACHQCQSVDASLGWGLIFRAVVCGIF